MDTDKNRNILEKQLKTLGQKVRIDILKKLRNSQSPLSFSRLQKEILENDFSSVNLSFHLNTLKRSKLVDSFDEGYSISLLGKQILDKVLSIEQILNQQNQTRMIRTSKYSKELFDVTKIEEYLVTEGELERFLSKQIAREVEERLSKTNIEYMTAPLMREYINAVLLENGLEEVRHKLTRLGTPPFEVSKLFESNDTQINPEIFIEKLGSDVSEQFLLLNLIPKNLADLYLSGEIVLLHLNYWALRPLSLYIETKSLIEYLFKKNYNFLHQKEKIISNSKLIIQFLDILYNLKPFYSEDLVLGNFNNQFLSSFSIPKERDSDFLLLNSEIIRFNNCFNKKKPSLTLEFNYDGNSSNQIYIDELYLNSLDKRCGALTKPLLLFEYSKLLDSESMFNIYDRIINYFKNNLILYNKTCSNLINSTIIQISNPQKNQVILDKILINLPIISVKAKQNDEKFMELLHEKLISVFELFHFKEKLVQKKLDSLKPWNTIISKILNTNKKNVYKNALKSISFFGFNEAVLNHCGIELDRTKNSESFALKILALMNKIIEEKNDINNNNFVLSQPHYDSYLQNSWHNGITNYFPNITSYSSKLIRTESKLSFNRKLKLFKKFQRIINKGALFSININKEEINSEKFLKTLIESKISAISLQGCIN